MSSIPVIEFDSGDEIRAFERCIDSLSDVLELMKENNNNLLSLFFYSEYASTVMDGIAELLIEKISTKTPDELMESETCENCLERHLDLEHLDVLVNDHHDMLDSYLEVKDQERVTERRNAQKDGG